MFLQAQRFPPHRTGLSLFLPLTTAHILPEIPFLGEIKSPGIVFREAFQAGKEPRKSCCVIRNPCTYGNPTLDPTHCMVMKFFFIHIRNETCRSYQGVQTLP